MPDLAKAGKAEIWRPVPADEAGLPRYKRIFLVNAYQNGELVSRGLGWSVNGARAATAAHVLSGDQFRADKCELVWLAAGTTVTSALWQADDGYISPVGARQKGSGSDVARIAVDLPPPPPSNPLPAVAVLEFVRWRDGGLQRAYSAFNEVLPFLGHGVATEPGDSGGPVFLGDRVVGMVLGNAAISRKYLPKPLRPRLSEPGSALAITPNVLKFLLT
ncbi:MAG: hypothetical protein EON86_03555 [Brevundimonas sp.]|nr:MAG: hypothetical protein EON86_03555 [Brevundimonas sp.]